MSTPEPIYPADHILVVGEGHTADDPDWTMTHPADCPQEVTGQIIDKEFRYCCNVQFCLDHVGILDLEDDGPLAPGEYRVRFHSYWSGSLFDDAEAYAYIYIVREEGA